MHLDDAGLDAYLVAIGEASLLSADEERALAARVAAGGGPDGPLTEDATAAVKVLVQANLRLAVSVATKVRGAMSMDDAVQEGNLGLIRAAWKYDGSYRFSTYAWWWIAQFIVRGRAAMERTIRLPVHLHERIGSIRRTSNRLQQALGRDPTHAEIAAALGITAERIERALAAARPVFSLNQPYNENDEGDAMTLEGLLGYDPGDELDARIDRSELRELLLAALAALPERDRAIIEQRVGWDGGDGVTLEEAARPHGITRERTRQIANEAIRKLRQNPALRAYVRREREEAA